MPEVLAGRYELGRVLGNRDWILYIDCRVDGVVLKHGNQKFSLAALAKTARLRPDLMKPRPAIPHP